METQKKEVNDKGILSDLFNGTGVNPVAGLTKTPLALPEESEIKRLTEVLKKDSDSIESYRDLQHVQLTKIQMKLLDGITEEKIDAASLGEIAKAFSVLKDKELVMNGKATQITGLVGYLVQLEKEELEALQKGTVVEINPV